MQHTRINYIQPHPAHARHLDLIRRRPLLRKSLQPWTKVVSLLRKSEYGQQQKQNSSIVQRYVHTTHTRLTYSTHVLYAAARLENVSCTCAACICDSAADSCPDRHSPCPRHAAAMTVQLYSQADTHAWRLLNSSPMQRHGDSNAATHRQHTHSTSATRIACTLRRYRLQQRSDANGHRDNAR